jgi:uncharacterized Tic20 family protein
MDFSEEKESARERDWAMAVHLSALVVLLGVPSIIGPLVIWLWKKEEFPSIDAHGREAVNFQVSIYLYLMLAGIVSFILFISIIGIPLLLLGIPFFFIFVLIATICPIWAGLKAQNGCFYRYPLTIRFLR